jgi:hypothetical protein
VLLPAVSWMFQQLPAAARLASVRLLLVLAWLWQGTCSSKCVCLGGNMHVVTDTSICGPYAYVI